MFNQGRHISNAPSLKNRYLHQTQLKQNSTIYNRNNTKHSHDLNNIVPLTSTSSIFHKALQRCVLPIPIFSKNNFVHFHADRIPLQVYILASERQFVTSGPSQVRTLYNYVSIRTLLLKPCAVHCANTTAIRRAMKKLMNYLNESFIIEIIT